MNFTMSDLVSRRVVDREGVLYHIKLIVNLELNQWKSLHMCTISWI